MTWHSLPVLVMAGINAVAAVLFLGLHFVIARRSRAGAGRENLTFALLCLAIAAYDASCVAMYNAPSLAAGVEAQRFQFATSALIGATYIVFAWHFIGVPISWPARAAAGALLVLAPLLAFVDGPLTLTTARPSIKELTVAGRAVVYREAEPGPLCNVVMVIFAAAFMYNLVVLWGFFRARKDRGIAGVALATALSFVAATNDSLVSSGVYRSMYTIEYAYTGVLFAMGYALLLRVGALHEEVEALAAGLERTNEGLVVALAQARENARAKTEFLASISHELRTPLNAIINLPEGLVEDFVVVREARCGACGAAFELEADEPVDASTRCPTCDAAGGLVVAATRRFTGDGDRATQHLRTVGRAGRHLLGLVNDILDASKLELGRATLTREEIDVRDLVGTIADSVRPLAEKANVTLRTADVAPLRLSADRVKLGQVLFNLLGNAIKFSPAGSTVDVEATARGEAEDVLLVVRDRGIGIAKEHHDAIFEKFRQVEGGANRAYGGTGLGLAISKSIVELHGGRIWVESERGQGSAFFVLLPRDDARAASGAGAAASDATPAALR